MRLAPNLTAESRRPLVGAAGMILLSTILSFAGPALRAETPAPAGTMTSFKAADETVQAYLASPKSPGPHPGVVVIQEWWGLNDEIKGVADRIAGLGYLAIVPDL